MQVPRGKVVEERQSKSERQCHHRLGQTERGEDAHPPPGRFVKVIFLPPYNPRDTRRPSTTTFDDSHQLPEDDLLTSMKPLPAPSASAHIVAGSMASRCDHSLRIRRETLVRPAERAFGILVSYLLSRIRSILQAEAPGLISASSIIMMLWLTVLLDRAGVSLFLNHQLALHQARKLASDCAGT